MATKDYILVAALDFGTTYSGYAFQMTSEYRSSDPTNKILSPQLWNEGSTRLPSLKTPTCLLLDTNGDIDSFGYVAEDRYAEICMDGDNKNFYYFRRFKMQLFDTKGLTRGLQITEEGGKQLSALTVFSRSIECLKMHVTGLLEKKDMAVEEDEVKWVLTVPAIWDDTAKGFMREAAGQAGIPLAHLTIALEPEAASLFCQYLPVEKFSVGGSTAFTDAKPGTTYMIVDLGGGTADITVHEKVSAGKLKEVHRADGGPWGGTSIDGAFLKLLSDIVGGPVMAAFIREHKYDYLDMMRDFEAIKRHVGLTNNDDIRMKLPLSLSDTCNKIVGKDFRTLVKVAKKDSQITFVGDKAKFEANLMRSLFKKTTDKIVDHMKGIIEKKPCGKNISLILMVGGFSESLYVQEVIKQEFHEKNGRRVLIPKDAGISVVQGAVVFGRQPDNITSRVLRYTYGTGLNKKFEAGTHDPKRRNNVAGVDRCHGCFGKFMEVGEDVKSGHKVEKTYQTTDPGSTFCTVDVFVSDKQDPKYTDDQGCQKLGTLRVDIPNPSPELRSIKVEYIFGDTELHLIATDVKTNTPCQAKLKMFE